MARRPRLLQHRQSGRRPYLPLHRYIIEDLLRIGFLMRGEIIWDKAASAASSTAWGSWQSAANPTLRDVHEYILVLCKDTYRRPKFAGRESTITREDFLDWTRKDVEVFGKPLEVKTATENGSVKAKWTADTVSAKNDINRLEFASDLLLVRIWWGKERDSVFYVPVEVLQELTDTQPARDYLTSASGTNNRGIEIARSFLARAEQHDETIRIPIRWCRSNMRVDPLARWRPIWSDSNYRDLFRR